MSKEDYKPPRVTVGDLVWWRQGKTSDPTAAIITAISGIAVDLAILHPGAYNFVPRAAVRHASHPDKDYPLVTETGTWEHRHQFQVADVGELPKTKQPISSK